MKTNQHTDIQLDLSSWNRERSMEELRSFVSRRFSALDGVEVE